MTYAVIQSVSLIGLYNMEKWLDDISREEVFSW